MVAIERKSVRVLLVSPRKRILLFKYRNVGADGIARPCWATAGGGCDEGEMVEETARREILEETGMTDARLGPVVWYGEDNERCGDGRVLFKEHFIVAYAPHEAIDRSGWTQWERDQIVEVRWWTAAELDATEESIFPRNLGRLIAPIMEGEYPDRIVVLPPI